MAAVLTMFGSGTVVDGDPAYETARRIGRIAAEAGWHLCNGGYGGTMEAGARGAAEADGHTIGVTCRAFGAGGPNAFIREEVVTETLFERLERLIGLGSRFLVLPGGSGTLVELALVIELLNKRLLPPDRRVGIVGSCWTPILELLSGTGGVAVSRLKGPDDVPAFLSSR